MLTFLIVASILLILIFVFLQAIRLFLSYERNCANDLLIVKILLFKKITLYKYCNNSFVRDVLKNTMTSGKSKKHHRSSYSKYKFYYFTGIIIEDISIRIAAGVGDASYTAILYGLLWNMISIIFLYVDNNIKVFKKSINILPDFNKPVFDINFNCLVKFRSLRTILAILKHALLNKINTRKIGDTNG